MVVFWNNNSKPRGRSSVGWFGSKLNDYGMALKGGDLGAIPWVFCVFAENHAASKTVAAELLSAALPKLTFNEIVRIDERMRQTTSMEWSINWRQLSIDDFFTPEMSDAQRRAVVIFASFNPNGFIREQAVRQMSGYANTLPFATLRQNDWVPQVRSVAAETSGYRLRHLCDGGLIAALPFADKLCQSGRATQGNTCVRRIYAALTSKAHTDELSAGFGAENIRTRRFCTDALFNAETPQYGLAFDRLERESDPFLRSSIYKRLVHEGQNLNAATERSLKDNLNAATEQFLKDNLNAATERFLEDKYPLSRLLAFSYLCNHNDERASEAAKKLLLDKSAAVRESARLYLSKTEPTFDCRAFYKAHIGTSGAPAILGLGETGKAEDTAQIEVYLKCEQTAQVRAAMTAAMRLNGEKYAARVTEFLVDDRAGIVKTARSLIIKIAEPDYAKVMELLRAASSNNTREKCFSVLLTAGKWQRLIYILEVLDISGGEVEEKAQDALSRWMASYNYSPAAASNAQIDKITTGIDRLGKRLPAHTRQQLLFLLR